MNAVAYYSNTDESRLIAEYFSNELGFPLINIEKSGTLPLCNYFCKSFDEIIEIIKELNQ